MRKSTKRSRQWSTEERETRLFHRDVRRLKQWCKENNITLMTHEEAGIRDITAICVLSPSEYDIGELVPNVEDMPGVYFLHEEDYEMWLSQN